jgi:hypothetical protein
MLLLTWNTSKENLLDFTLREVTIRALPYVYGSYNLVKIAEVTVRIRSLPYR